MGSAPDDDQRDHLIVARVRRPHGVRGEVLVAVDTDRPKHVFRAGRNLHLADARGRLTGRSLTLEAIRPTTGGAILRLSGIANREDSEALRGHALLIAAGDAQAAAPDEVRYRDLVGLSATVGEEHVGVVEDILQMPTGEMLVVRGSNGREILIPFVREIVVDVDLAARALRLNVPDGLLEL
jgi:16S rRNA processing protein RimM